MPQTIEGNVMGFELTFEDFPSTIAELLTLNGISSEKDIVAITGNYIMSHNHYSKIRSVICEKIKELTGEERLVDKKTGKTESQQSYKNRVEAILQKDGKSLYTTYLQEIVDTVQALEIDLSRQTRSSTTNYANVPQKWKDTAYEVVVKEGKVEVFCEKYDVVIDEDDDDDIILGKIGLKIKEVQDEARKEAEAELTASLT